MNLLTGASLLALAKSIHYFNLSVLFSLFPLPFLFHLFFLPTFLSFFPVRGKFNLGGVVGE